MASATEKRAGGKTNVLQSEDGNRFELSKEATRVSKVIGAMIGEGHASIPIPIPSRELAKVCGYCTKHAGVGTSNSGTASTIPDWGKEFVSSIDIGFVFTTSTSSIH